MKARVVSLRRKHLDHHSFFPKLLFNQVSNGLTNRIMSIISSQKIAEVCNRELVLIWKNEIACPCFFEDIFEKNNFLVIKDISDFDTKFSNLKLTEFLMKDQIIGVDLLKLNEDIVYIKSPILNVDKCEKNQEYTDYLIDKLYLDGKHRFDLAKKWKDKKFEKEARNHRDALIEVQKNCYDYIKKNLLSYLENLKIKKEIIKVVENFSKIFNDKTAGVHIRLTDNPFPYADYEIFENKTKNLIDAGYDIFLASDNKSSEENLKEKFKDKIITYQKEYAIPDFIDDSWPPKQYRHTSVVDAMVDLLLLSKTRKIFKPCFSTFGILSALYGGIEYECVY